MPLSTRDVALAAARLVRAVSFRLLAGFAVACVGASAAAAEGVQAPARALIARVDALDVEHRWPAGVHVHWDSGLPDGQPESGGGKHTHCSAFVAAAAKQFGIYILRPPEHAQILLANAQFDWLRDSGAHYGWHRLDGALAAQAAANRGEFVVATYKNARADKPGHIAIVRPSDKADAAVQRDGPEITQAGGSNYRDTTLARGFAGHPAAWGAHEVMFYAHAVRRD